MSAFYFMKTKIRTEVRIYLYYSVFAVLTVGIELPSSS